MPADFGVETRRLADGRIVAAFSGEVDVTNIAAFRQILDGAATEGTVVADLTAIRYLDSAGVEVLFDLARRADLEIVAGPDCLVRRLIDVVALGQAATVRDTLPA